MEAIDSPKAKVFVSCGQREGSEQEAAKQIGAVLEALGFDYYIAVNEATLTGLKENVFRQLEQSEYILFVDFKREQLANLQLYRGSLFSHQELAVAAYLGLEWLPFQQDGVERNGIMSFTQSNAIRFSSMDDLPKLVREQVLVKGWRSDWKNGLRIQGPSREVDSQIPSNLGMSNRTTGQEVARFFHLEVENLNPRKLAVNCCAYVERILNIDSGDQIPVETVELRWSGFDSPSSTILPKSKRAVDAGYILHRRPEAFFFNSFSTSTQYLPPLIGPGDFLLDYVVASETFPPARHSIRASLRRTFSETHIEASQHS